MNIHKPGWLKTGMYIQKPRDTQGDRVAGPQAQFLLNTLNPAGNMGKMGRSWSSLEVS